MDSLAKSKNPISSSGVGSPAKESLRPGEGLFAGHSLHCDCEKMAKEFERAYAERTRKMALLERVARAAEKHRHLDNEKECPICIYLRELNA